MSAFPDNVPRTLELLRAGDVNEEASSNAAAEKVAAFLAAFQGEASTPLFLCIDQRALPEAEVYLCTSHWEDVVGWIQTLAVRGAPAIGAAGAAAMALASYEFASSFQGEDFLACMDEAARIIGSARPTAVNLSWAVKRLAVLVHEKMRQQDDPEAVAAVLYCEAQAIMDEDEETNRALGHWGATLLKRGSRVLTHCNAGSLATSFYGTALGVIYAAASEGKIERVYADETRPVCQGSRLTVWELAKAQVPVTLICDDMAATVMASGAIDAVIVGADRIAANGDVANKIGTLGVAVLAHHFGCPFYVAAPTSTIDPDTATGDDIVIEQRSAEEVLAKPIQGVDVLNPAFDITPAALITAIVCERGIFRPQSILSALNQA